ncbi:unnamed protein product [Rotaria sordida]|uniref:tubulin-glutamate carboxypeptidase n=2 Tax=Rotaria sordida TaxID=392033 RepID=A0A814HGB2_9BILA|nr:unnamed protein product [Rotaria sordida]CAF1010554.1 unnamed protein product [Rotaria sordida]
MNSNDVSTTNSSSSSSSSSIQLFANFDSGNILRYERVTSSTSSSQPSTNPIETDTNTNTTTTTTNNNNNNSGADNGLNTISHTLPKHDIEFNVWTKRDCEGTPRINGNRSWFYFGVKGGYGKCIRFNIMNLNRQGKLFEMGMLPVFRTVPGHEKWSRIYIRPCWETINEDFKLSFVHRMADLKNSITYFAFCFPHSYEDMQQLLNTYDNLYNSRLADYYLEHPSLPVNNSDIYYHRETLCYSCDSNKIDLITITSYKGITKEREHHFDKKLFPDASTINKRPYQFRNKRIFFLSSRVHPGETPAAFVFLGFLDFILKIDDPRAKLLRDSYIFKLIPILNPDGVQRGHYRTDQFGVNLNRMYLDPDFEKHPSIYAAKSLIAYHHINNCVSPRSPLSVYDIFKDVMPSEQLNNQQILNDSQFQGKSTPRRTQFQQEILCETTMINSTQPNNNTFENLSLDEQIINDENGSFFIERSENGLIQAVTTEIDDLEMQRSSPYAFRYINENLELHQDLFIVNNNDDDEDEGNLRNQIKGNEGSDDDDDMPSSGQTNENGVHEVKSPHLANPDLLKISPYESGIAYYIDLHGHASKKGCFVYGNHLPDDDQHTDNVLFAKLISLNSPHFDFENCNFTIKNMYMKDKREGLSKEGSGRVALNKHFGILHSYTLECSYAVGKSCNSISAAENDAHGGRISPATPFSLPPKFTIDHYRDVGKACALAAIDILPGRNQFTRVNQSTFKTLHTLRDFLKHQIRQQRNRIGNSRIISSTIPPPSSTTTTTTVTTNRAKQQQYMARVTQTYRTTTNPNNLSAVTHQQQQMTSSFPLVSSAPPSTITNRITSNNQLNRISATHSNQSTSSSRFKTAYDNRRYSNVQTPYKRSLQYPITSNPKLTPTLSRNETSALPSARLVLQQQISSPGRLQHLQRQSSSSPQFVTQVGSILDPLVVGRTRPPQLPPPTVRNAIQRNAVSLHTLPINQQNGTMTRGRSQNSAHKGSLSTRTSKIRQQSLAPFDLQQPPLAYSSATVIYQHPLNTDQPPVFFE